MASCCYITVPAALAESPTSAQSGGFSDLRVGRTNILCYQEPCPWNGVSAADGPIGPHTLLRSNDTPPPMRGAIKDRIHLLKNYRDHCTLINGRFRQGVLEVAKVLGSC